MEIRTCEEYVLALLNNAQEEATRYRDELSVVLNTLRDTIDKLNPTYIEETNTYSFNPIEKEVWEGLINKFNTRQ